MAKAEGWSSEHPDKNPAFPTMPRGIAMYMADLKNSEA